MRRSIPMTIAAAGLVAVSFTAAFSVGAARQLTGTAAAAVTTGPAPCHSPSLPSGDAIKVDAAGNAWTPDTAVKGTVHEFVCTDGRWIPVTGYGTAAKPALPAWAHWKLIPDACGRGDAGIMMYATGADQTVVICKNGDIEPS